MRGFPVIVLLVSGLGCELEPDALVLLAGRVERAGGGHAAHAPVVLSRQAFDGPLTDATSDSYAAWKALSADAEGELLIEFRARELRWESGAERSHQLTLPEELGSRTTVRFEMRGGDNRLPAIESWAPGLLLESEAGRSRLRWRAAPSHDPAAAVAYTVRFQGGGGPLWQQEGSADEGVFVPDVLEDIGSPEAVVQARASGESTWYPLNGQSAHLGYSFSWESAPLAIPATASVPLSRGADCTYRNKPAGPCLLTDGRMETVVLPEEAAEILLTLPVPQILGRALLRGIRLDTVVTDRTLSCSEATLRLEGSLDGESWVQLASVPSHARAPDGEHFVEGAWASTDPVARVRIRGVCKVWETPVTFRSVRETSLY